MLMHKIPVNILLLALLGIVFVAFYVNAEESNQQVELSLQDCISLALKSNLNIRIQNLNPQIQDSILLMTKGRYDPSLSFNINTSSSEGKSVSQKTNAQSFGFGIKDPIITGGEYGISLNSSRSDSDSISQSLNPAYRSGTVFSISQPLMEGFGIGLNRIPIIIAKNNKDISTLRLKSQLIKNLTDVQNTYWELVFAIENLKVQELALKQAQDLLNLNIKLKENDKASLSDILQAQSAVASREADVLSAKDAIKDAEDKLKRITNIIQDESQWEISIIPTDTPISEEISVDIQDSIALALEKRPEYLQAKLDVENSDLTVKLAKNQKLPIIDLDGSLSLNGLGDKFSEPYSQVGKAENRTWTAGIALRMPLGGKSDNGYLKKSQLEKEQKLLALKDQEQQVIADVRSAVRQLDTGIKRIQATTKAEEFARQVLATEEKKYSLGLSTSYNLLQFQANLATATKNRLRAVIDYRKSVVNLYQSQGVTLDRLNIAFEE
ncbi:TPA: TolC family protein [Candidatus Poribacteria bacterium]|nr:TolC family protein [Candidatus Poribacteria bacterium]